MEGGAVEVELWRAGLWITCHLRTTTVLPSTSGWGLWAVGVGLLEKLQAA